MKTKLAIFHAGQSYLDVSRMSPAGGNVRRVQLEKQNVTPCASSRYADRNRLSYEMPFHVSPLGTNVPLVHKELIVA